MLLDMSKRKALGRGVTGVLCASVLAVGAAQAEGARSNEIAVSRSAGDALSAYLKVATDANRDWSRIETGRVPALQVGQYVAVCVTAARAGFLSVWSRSSDGAAPSRIFPNDFTPEDRRNKAGKVQKGEEICFGDGSRGFQFKVSPPYGRAEVYMHWSGQLNAQFGPEDMPKIPDPGTREVASTRAFEARYSSTVISYVVQR